MTETTNLHLKKPDTSDFYNIEDFNGNADILDAEIKKLQSSGESKADKSYVDEQLEGKADKSDIPTSLPANGGNADTLGNIAPSGFLLAAASRKLTTSLNASGLIGTYYCEDRFTPDYPKDSSGNAYGQYGLLDVRIYGSIFYQTMMFENGIMIHRARIAGVGDWSSWQKLNDGGNAATVNGHSVNSDVPANAKFTDTTYSPGTGISISGTTISNSGVRSVATGSSNGTISVNTNGTAANVAVKGLASAAYQAVQTAAGTVGLHRISSGSAAATTTNCPAGCWYGQYE